MVAEGHGTTIRRDGGHLQRPGQAPGRSCRRRSRTQSSAGSVSLRTRLRGGRAWRTRVGEDAPAVVERWLADQHPIIGNDEAIVSSHPRERGGSRPPHRTRGRPVMDGSALPTGRTRTERHWRWRRRWRPPGGIDDGVDRIGHEVGLLLVDPVAALGREEHGGLRTEVGRDLPGGTPTAPRHLSVGQSGPPGKGTP